MQDNLDYGDLKYNISEIESCLGKMERHKLNYCGDIRFHLDEIDKLFELAFDKSVDQRLFGDGG